MPVNYLNKNNKKRLIFQPSFYLRVGRVYICQTNLKDLRDGRKRSNRKRMANQPFY